MYPYDFVQLTETSKGRTFPYRGMTYVDYSKILTEFGVFPEVGRFIRHRKRYTKDEIEFNKESFLDLCTYIESGFPVLTSIPNHVITLMGHTINHEFTPPSDSGKYLDSSCFLGKFVVVDDNHFPYCMIGANFSESDTCYKDKRISFESFKAFVVPVPEKVFSRPKDIRQKTNVLLPKIEKLFPEQEGSPYIKRTFLTSNSAFKKRKLDLIFKTKQFSKSAYTIASMHLPHFIWVVELSTTSSYKKGKIFAEIVFDASAGKHEDGLIFITIGDQIQKSGKSLKDVPVTFIDQYTHNLGEL